MPRRNRLAGVPRWIFLPCLAALLQTGCTSAITTAYLRDTLFEGGDHAEESAAIAVSAEGDEKHAAPDDGAAETTSAAGQRSAEPEVDASRRAAAIEEAVARLSKLGTLDETARATLIDTLRKTQQEDWPVVIEAFAETLAAAGPPAAAAVPASVAGEPHVVAKATTEKPDVLPVVAAADDVAATKEPSAAPPPESSQSTAETTSGPQASGPDTSAGAAADVRPALAVQNAAFASKVRAWGDLDRFPDNRFRPGQEVIVYFELENLSAGDSPAGHTTCIDTVIRLEGPGGESVHDWSFEPIAETLKARRRDYFARYVVHIPESTPAGGCRLQLTVTDTLAGRTARASLPLELVAE